MAGALGAADIVRGVSRALIDADHAVLTELPLANGRRADLVAVDRVGQIAIVEVKSSTADFRSDRKWRDYLPYCDRFFFAVADHFPIEILPAEEGLIIADRYAGEVIRPAMTRSLSGARRKAVLIRFARAAAGRLYGLDEGALL